MELVGERGTVGLDELGGFYCLMGRLVAANQQPATLVANVEYATHISQAPTRHRTNQAEAENRESRQ
jgi:hypothetical protein